MKIKKKGSATVLIAVFVAVLFVAVAFIYGKVGPSEASYATLPEIATSSRAASVSLASIDTDKDGLMDWEEALWRSNPRNPDSDGDGRSDGEEVQNKRNPIIPGPEDKLSDNFIEENSVSEKLTATDLVARAVFAEYWKTRSKNGDFIDPSQNTAIISQAISSAELPRPRVYTEGDIVITADESEAATREYADAMGKAIRRHAVSTENEITILERSLSRGKEEELEKLDEITNSYQKTLDEMLLVSSPASLTKLHLSIINSVASILRAVASFRNSFNDPVSAMLELSAYPQNVESMVNSFKQMSTHFKNLGLQFERGDDGDFFANLFKP